MTSMTESIVRTPIMTRAAWMGAELARGEDWLIPLARKHQDEHESVEAEIEDDQGVQ